MWLVWSGSAKGLFGSYDELKILKHDTVLELPFFLGWRKYFTCVGKYNSLMHGGRFQRTTPSHKKKSLRDWCWSNFLNNICISKQVYYENILDNLSKDICISK